MNKKERRAALKSALTSKVQDNKLVVVDALTLADVKTKEMQKVLTNLKAEKALVITATDDKNVILSTSYRAFGDYPVNLILALIAYLLCAFILKYTKIGTYTYAIGSNEVVAKNMGVNVSKYKIVAFTLAGFFFGLQAILTISFGTSMTSASNLSSMSRNFTPLMGTFFGLAFKKYGHPVVAIVIGEMIIQLMFNGFVALGAPTTIQNVVTGVALLAIVALTTKPVKGLVVK